MTTTKSRAGKAAERAEQDRMPGDPTPGAITPDLEGAGETDYDETLAGGEPVDADDFATERAEAGTGPVDRDDLAGDESLSEAEASQDPDGDTDPEGGEIVPDPDPEAAGPEATGPEGDQAEQEAVTPRNTRRNSKPRTPKAPKAPKAAADPKPPKAKPQPGTCLCGCGETCVRPQAQFVRGHDSVLAKALRAAYAAGDMTAEQVREHAGRVSDKFLGKLNKSIAAVDAEQAAISTAAEARRAMLESSMATVTAKTTAS